MALDMLKPEDIINYGSKCLPYLVPFLILVVVAIALAFVTKKYDTPRRKLVRSESVIAVIPALGATGICMGPMRASLDMVLAPKAGRSEETAAAVSLLDGLKNAGFELDDELSAFYTDYSAVRETGSLDGNTNWMLPEPSLEGQPQVASLCFVFHIVKGECDTLVYEFVAGNAHDPCLTVSLDQHRRGYPHRDHFFFCFFG